MCNKLHKDSKPIPKSGKGCKLFTVYSKSKKIVSQWMNKNLYYICRDSYVVWNDLDIGDGFCFFIEKPDRYMENRDFLFSDEILLPIIYDDGLGTHRDKYMGGEKIALCKKFKIDESKTDYRLA